MEKLQEEQAIKIEIVRQMDGKSIDDMQKEAMDLLRDDILKDFFKPALSAAPPGAPAGSPPASGAITSAPTTSAISHPATTPASPANAANAAGPTTSSTRVDIGFQLNYMTEDELRTATFDYSVAAPETKLHAPCGFFSLLLKGTQRADLIRDISLDDPFFRTFSAQITTIVDWAAIDLKTIVVDAQYGGSADAPTVSQSYTFTPTDAAAKTFQAYIENFDASWRRAVRYTFGVDDATSAQRSSYQTPMTASTSRALVVAPQDDVPMLRVYVEPGVVDWDLVAKIETTLSYDDPANNFHAEAPFLIASDSPRKAWTVRLTTPELDTYTVHHLWHLKDGRQISAQPYQSRAPQLFVPDPFVDRIPISVSALVDPTSIARVTVALAYIDKPNNVEVHKSIDLVGPTFAPAALSIPIVDAKQRTYTYTASLIGTNGNVEQRPAVETTDLALAITDGSVVLDAQITLLGDLAALQASGIQVDLQTDPPDGQQPVVQSHLFEPGGDRKWTQRLLLRSDRPSRTFQYRTTVFADGRDPTPTDWTDCDTPMLTLLASRIVHA